jgi:hypothetical protein
MVFSAFPAPERKPRFAHAIKMNAVNMNTGGDLPASSRAKDCYCAHRESLSPLNEWTKTTSLLLECVAPIAVATTQSFWATTAALLS